MAANCAQLRQSLAHLQTQLNVLTNKQKEDSPKPEPKPEKQEKKKSKSKKNKAEKKAETTPKAESDEKELTDDNQNSANETTQKVDKVDDETLETLIQAINNANINLCDLEVVSDEIAETIKVGPKIEEINEGVIIEDVTNKPESATVSPVENNIVENGANDLAEEVKEIKDGVVLPKAEVSEVLPATEIKIEDANLTSKDSCQNVSIIELPNEEISHINEVKPISDNA